MAQRELSRYGKARVANDQILGQEVEMMEERVAPLALSVQEAVAATGLSRTSLYRALRDGRLTCFKVGGRTLFSPEHLQQFLAAHESNRAKAVAA